MKASEKLVRILIKPGGNEKFFGKYGVNGTPTLKFLDSKGKEVDAMKSASPDALEKQIIEISDKYSMSPKFIEDVSKAFEEAKSGSKPLAIYFYDTQGGSAAMDKALLDESLKPVLEKFVFAKTEVKKGSEECKKYGVTASNTILVINTALEKPEKSPVKKITGKKSAKDLAKELEDAIKKLEKK